MYILVQFGVIKICITLVIRSCIPYSIILEADSGAVVQRVALRADDIPIGEQTVAQVSYY